MEKSEKKLPAILLIPLLSKEKREKERILRGIPSHYSPLLKGK
jgi:hypothetical protein